MKLIHTIAIAAATVGLAGMANAQRWPIPDRGRDYRYDQRDNRGLRNLVDQAERESNAFRDYFERHYRDRGHSKQYDYRGDHGDHEGRYGQMTLKDAIQNLDEAFERLRSAVGRNDYRDRGTRDAMRDILEHSRDVDVRIGRVGDAYIFDQSDRWNGGYNNGYNMRGRGGDELSYRWRELRRDIDRLARMFDLR